MKYSFAMIGMIAFGIVGVVFIFMLNNITISNESEYYVLKEAMEAAMIESVDLTCYRIPDTVIVDEATGAKGCGGTIKISEQKFVENFTRRFAASISGDISEYTINFYDIIESPPKATVFIVSTTNSYQIGTSSVGEDGIKGTSDDNSAQSFNIVNKLSGILESTDWSYYLENIYKK